MAQKTKVKELVGRGLHSYHTKALQQVDRIEKKNKEQNHKISILSNELDNDYLNKTEEGSVISLEHSKEGMIYLDELQGNTLVNYCTDGSKELTLNGDIDVEGTFVTTTEGVDNGKVDVMCEGNTLVNLKLNSGEKCHVAWQNSNTVNYFTLSENSSIHLKGEIVESANILKFGWGYGALGKFNSKLLKPNTTYTIILDNPYDWLSSFSLMQGNATNVYHKSNAKISKNIYTVTTKDSFEGLNDKQIILYGNLNGSYKGKVDCTVVAMLEGDWSNKEIPTEFFEGMKSVGQDDTNGHKIEILSQNKNLVQSIINGGINNTNGNLDNAPSTVRSEGYISVKSNATYTISNNMSYNNYIYEYDENKKFIGYSPNRVNPCTFTTTNNTKYITFRSTANEGQNDLNVKYQIEEGTIATSYVQGSMNKKEILINEPLVGNSTVKDKVIKIGGKWFVEKLWKTVTLDGTQEIIKGAWDVPIFSYNVPNTEGEPTNFPNTLMCDRIKPQNFNLSDNTHWALYTGKDTVASKRYIRIQIPASIVAKDDLEGFKTWLRNNPVTIAYRLNTPIYEPLEVEPTLNTYNDITHISNNSIIPCNMKIQNSGYNAIIKPSTLYTIALDTNKSGTIGMNLGGAKGTTTNNVLKLTTPATLTDDSLRLYGKGIKGSKVRLLEGDKTNWIPSFFEGMKSSFEDKVQDDGSYKMEILMNNENLLDIKNISYKNTTDYKLENNKIIINTSKKYQGLYYYIPVKRGSRYTICCKNITGGGILLYNGKVTGHMAEKFLGGINNNNNPKKTSVVAGEDYITIRVSSEVSVDMDCIFEDTLFYKGTGKVDYVPHKQNKIQFSSIEPLRGIGNIKDRFVFKDGKLMIERNCGICIIDENVRRGGWGTPKPPFKGFQFFFDFLNNTSLGKLVLCPTVNSKIGEIAFENIYRYGDHFNLNLREERLFNSTINEWIKENNLTVVYGLDEPIYEEIPFELQKIILEGYENGTLFIDTNIPPTSTVTYAGETPIVKATKLNKTEVLNNTNDINDNIIPYLMDMDYRVVMLQLATEELEGGVSMARLFGGTYEMIKRDILSKRLTREEYGYRLADYFNAGKLTEQEVRELEDLR